MVPAWTLSKAFKGHFIADIYANDLNSSCKVHGSLSQQLCVFKNSANQYKICKPSAAKHDSHNSQFACWSTLISCAFNCWSTFPRTRQIFIAFYGIESHLKRIVKNITVASSNVDNLLFWCFEGHEIVKQLRANDAISPPLLWSCMCVCLRVSEFSGINRRSRMTKNSKGFKVTNGFFMLFQWLMTYDESMEALCTCNAQSQAFHGQFQNPSTNIHKNHSATHINHDSVLGEARLQEKLFSLQVSLL